METGTNDQDMVLYLSAEQAATVTVTIETGSLNPPVTTYNVPANTTITTTPMPKSGSNDVRLFPIPPGIVVPGVDPCRMHRSIHIQSNVPIVAYAHIYGSASSGATLLLPTSAWGHAYRSLNSFQTYAPNTFSWLYVIAKEDNTVVEITPGAATRYGQTAGQPFTVTLNKGDVYQLMGGPETGSAKAQLTGSSVRSLVNSSGVSHPIAVFSGSSRTTGELSCGGSGGGDNDMQQAFPAHAWGTRYLTAPFSASTAANILQNNVYKIIPRWPNTVVRRNGVVLTPGADGFYIFASNQPELIEADLPILVGQFMGGGSTCLGGGVGDPEMVYLTALDQGISSARFFRNNRESITVNYATVIMPASGFASLAINGSTVFDHVYDHTRLPGYKIAVKRWTAAQALVQIQCDSAFTAITYGLGSVESYGYNVGVLVRNLDANAVIRPGGSVAAVDTIQAGAPFRFAVQSPHRLTSITWQLSSVAGLSPSADVTVQNPVPADSMLIHGRRWYSYLTDNAYTAAVAGTYGVPVQYTFPQLENTGQRGNITYNLNVVAGVATAVGGRLQVDAPDVSLSPNPAHDAVNVVLHGRQGGTMTATLLGKLGTPVGRPVTFSGNTVRLEVKDLPAGVYVLVLTDARTGKRFTK
ncbi:MAG: hypothetical protein EOO16_06240, partial [Chitinophagaceae bacterium]